MSTIEERRKILEQVAAGQMNAQDAAKLLKDAFETSKVQPIAAPEPVAAPEPQPIMIDEVNLPPTKEVEASAKAPTWLHIRITDNTTGKRKVSVNIPLRLMKIGWKIGRGFVSELQAIDWDDLTQSLSQAQVGSLIDVEDDDDNTHVQIYID